VINLEFDLVNLRNELAATSDKKRITEIEKVSEEEGEEGKE